MKKKMDLVMARQMIKHALIRDMNEVLKRFRLLCPTEEGGDIYIEVLNEQLALNIQEFESRGALRVGEDAGKYRKALLALLDEPDLVRKLVEEENRVMGVVPRRSNDGLETQEKAPKLHRPLDF